MCKKNRLSVLLLLLSGLSLLSYAQNGQKQTKIEQEKQEIIKKVTEKSEPIKIKHGPYLQNLKETEVTIVWESNLPSRGWVELAPDDGTHFYHIERPVYFDTNSGIKKTSYLHAVKIKNLTPGTTYRYRVSSQEVLSHKGNRIYLGLTASSEVYSEKPLTFTTNDSRKSETSFVMLNDIHEREDDIAPLLEVADYKDKDLVIYNGDMLSILTDSDRIFRTFMDTTITLFAKEKPMYYARGNHETRGAYAEHFQKYISPLEPHLYYMFTQGPVCFVVLDTGEDKPDSSFEYSGLVEFDSYRTEQAAWLEKVVQTDEYKQARFRVIIAHMPPVSDKSLWHGPRDVLEKFVPILNKANVDLMLSGHLHRYVYVEPSSTVNFPVLINAHRTAVKAETAGNDLNVEVLDLKGKVIDKKSYKAK